jgi:hypothetical protein
MTNIPDDSTTSSTEEPDPSGSETWALGVRSTPVRFGLAARLLSAVFVGLMLTVVVAVAIWPGEMKLLAPLFCSDAQPDAFVVADRYQVTPGETSYNFSLYCMGPRGDVTNVGVWKPYATLFAIHTAAVLLIFMWPSRRGASARRERAAAARTRPPGSTAGPFVD